MKTKLLPLLLLTVAANAFALDTPTEDFIDNNDGTVTHKKTGLTWQRCAVGQTWTGTNCSGTRSTFYWNQAIAQANGEWRVPRIDELYSITEHSSTSFINQFIFPNTSEVFWSSSDVLNAVDLAWFISFDDGRDDFDVKDNGLAAVRLVKGGNPILQSGKYTPTSEFSIDYTKGTAVHNKTNLMWQICAVGQYWTGSSCSGTPLKMNYATAISQNSIVGGYANWRLPSINELKTIVEYNNSPSVNSNVFLGTTSDVFWSSSLINSNGAWVIEFDSYGADNANGLNNNAAVRLVRENVVTAPAIQVTIDLSTTLSQSSSSVKINNNLTYTATAQNNGTGTANNVFLKFYMPPRWTNYVSLPSDCSFNGTTTVCNVGSLAAGSSVSRSITVSFSKFRGATSVGAFAGSDEADTNKSNNMSRMITTVTK